MSQPASTMAPAKTTGSELSVKAAEIDRIASSAMALFEGASSFEAELQVAQSIRDLRAALTPEVMAPVMALMNTDLGFLTDKDPRKPNKDGSIPAPYTVEIVRDCLIEAKLRGFHAIGNEFNIIAKRFYAARNGLKRRCETWPGVTDLKIVVGLPRIQGDQATVAIFASWKKNGVKDEIVAPGGKPLEVLIKVNNFMGPDAVVGKAERKLYKRIFDRLSGKTTPEGEVGDEELANAKAANATVAPPPPPPPPAGPAAGSAPSSAPAAPSSPAGAPGQNPDEAAESAAGLAPSAAGSSTGNPGGMKDPDAAVEEFANFFVNGGVSWEIFSKYGRKCKWRANWDQIDGFHMLPKDLVELIWKGRSAVLTQINKWKEANRL